jgi:hypothetical protein
MLLQASDDDVGRVGFAGLLESVGPTEPAAVESPSAARWAPIGVSSGPSDATHRDAIDSFHRVLAARRDDTRS